MFVYVILCWIFGARIAHAIPPEWIVRIDEIQIALTPSSTFERLAVDSAPLIGDCYDKCVELVGFSDVWLVQRVLSDDSCYCYIWLDPPQHMPADQGADGGDISLGTGREVAYRPSATSCPGDYRLIQGSCYRAIPSMNANWNFCYNTCSIEGAWPPIFMSYTIFQELGIEFGFDTSTQEVYMGWLDVGDESNTGTQSMVSTYDCKYSMCQNRRTWVGRTFKEDSFDYDSTSNYMLYKPDNVTRFAPASKGTSTRIECICEKFTAESIDFERPNVNCPAGERDDCCGVSGWYYDKDTSGSPTVQDPYHEVPFRQFASASECDWDAPITMTTNWVVYRSVWFNKNGDGDKELLGSINGLSDIDACWSWCMTNHPTTNGLRRATGGSNTCQCYRGGVGTSARLPFPVSDIQFTNSYHTAINTCWQAQRKIIGQTPELTATGTGSEFVCAQFCKTNGHNYWDRRSDGDCRCFDTIDSLESDSLYAMGQTAVCEQPVHAFGSYASTPAPVTSPAPDEVYRIPDEWIVRNGLKLANAPSNHVDLLHTDTASSLQDCYDICAQNLGGINDVWAVQRNTQDNQCMCYNFIRPPQHMSATQPADAAFDLFTNIDWELSYLPSATSCPTEYTLIEGSCYRLLSSGGENQYPECRAKCQIDGATIPMFMSIALSESIATEFGYDNDLGGLYMGWNEVGDENLHSSMAYLSTHNCKYSFCDNRNTFLNRNEYRSTSNSYETPYIYLLAFGDISGPRPFDDPNFVHGPRRCICEKLVGLPAEPYDRNACNVAPERCCKNGEYFYDRDPANGFTQEDYFTGTYETDADCKWKPVRSMTNNWVVFEFNSIQNIGDAAFETKIVHTQPGLADLDSCWNECVETGLFFNAIQFTIDGGICYCAGGLNGFFGNPPTAIEDISSDFDHHVAINTCMLIKKKANGVAVISDEPILSGENMYGCMQFCYYNNITLWSYDFTFQLCNCFSEIHSYTDNGAWASGTTVCEQDVTTFGTFNPTAFPSVSPTASPSVSPTDSPTLSPSVAIDVNGVLEFGVGWFLKNVRDGEQVGSLNLGPGASAPADMIGECDQIFGSVSLATVVEAGDTILNCFIGTGCIDVDKLDGFDGFYLQYKNIPTFALANINVSTSDASINHDDVYKRYYLNGSRWELNSTINVDPGDVDPVSTCSDGCLTSNGADAYSYYEGNCTCYNWNPDRVPRRLFAGDMIYSAFDEQAESRVKNWDSRVDIVKSKIDDTYATLLGSELSGVVSAAQAIPLCLNLHGTDAVQMIDYDALNNNARCFSSQTSSVGSLQFAAVQGLLLGQVTSDSIVYIMDPDVENYGNLEFCAPPTSAPSEAPTPLPSTAPTPPTLSPTVAPTPPTVLPTNAPTLRPTYKMPLGYVEFANVMAKRPSN